MTDLQLLKQNLEIPNDLRDGFMTTLLDAAEREIIRHGIVPPNDTSEPDYQNLKVMYAAYLYRKRAEDVAAMPRMLQYALHNYLLAQKMEVSS